MEKKYNFTYKTTNLINGMVYYGVHGTNILNDGYLGSGNLLQKALSKYGIENFKREELSFYETYAGALEAERLLITAAIVKSRRTYNMKLGGYGGHVPGFKHSDKTKSKISVSNSGENSKFFGRKHTEETKAKMSEIRKGIQYSDETLSKMSEYAKNRLKEHRKNLSDSKKDKRQIKSICIKTGKEVCYSCRSEAGHALNISPSNIAKAADGKIKYAYGHYWEYI
ncbi:GIY-YIG homing endonuclease [Yersinia phage vB_YenM_TG1]|uniref:GIY-YIG homing endonuclease n=1 Tax=Yersinia phage vB_YenM_TG1 TaxID=1589265 RepID=A0A0B5A481_9CAUD|nr:homing endonuclease [Yersinia phage vB_YenM_TG1]AJD81876.1 GIY-YIG homing endonuclease [Yersinia phage vB_YenM_TG1]